MHNEPTTFPVPEPAAAEMVALDSFSIYLVLFQSIQGKFLEE
jgi:hypothetical protein